MTEETLPTKSVGRGFAPLAGIIEEARSYSEAARAENTQRAYRSDWEHFVTWCDSRRLAPLPAKPGTVAAYLTDHAGRLKASTLGHRLAAIRAAHAYAGKPIDLGYQALRAAF